MTDAGQPYSSSVPAPSNRSLDQPRGKQSKSLGSLGYILCDINCSLCTYSSETNILN